MGHCAQVLPTGLPHPEPVPVVPVVAAPPVPEALDVAAPPLPAVPVVVTALLAVELVPPSPVVAVVVIPPLPAGLPGVAEHAVTSPPAAVTTAQIHSTIGLAIAPPHRQLTARVNG
jgi:hypothetical protein